MKIAFHNKQRREQVDSRALRHEFERILDFLVADLTDRPPSWLKKKQLRAIFTEGTLSVTLVSNKAIRVLNKEWRQQDKATDVLSFPLDLEAPPALPEGFADAEQDEWLVGEVIISLERAREQAADFGHSLERELAFLFVHGVLHVLGFDHIKKSDEKEMFARQKAILLAAGIART